MNLCDGVDNNIKVLANIITTDLIEKHANYVIYPVTRDYNYTITESIRYKTKHDRQYKQELLIELNMYVCNINF